MTGGVQIGAWPHDKTSTWQRPAEFKNKICYEVTRLATNKFVNQLHAIVLTGSLARDEATFVQELQGWKLLGDSEFLLVFREGFSLPSGRMLNFLCREIEKEAAANGLECQVTLGAVYPSFLRELQPHIFSYEFRTCGKVVWGEPTILSLVPFFSPSEIPLEDAWRLLCNRMIELLEVAPQLPERPNALPRTVFYRTVKLYLDMATSLLVFAGAYEPTYLKRAERLRKLTQDPTIRYEFPFDLHSFSQRVSSCTEAKLLGTSVDNYQSSTGTSAVGLAFWEEAITYGQLLWRWEVARLTNTRDQVSDRQLLWKWMRLQPVHGRLRGWLYVLRKQGWHRSWRQWPRWMRRAWRASPRYWVYAVTRELFFSLPRLMKSDSQKPHVDADWEELRSWLPRLRNLKRSKELPVWKELAADLVSNYREFLVDTRA